MRGSKFRVQWHIHILHSPVKSALYTGRQRLGSATFILQWWATGGGLDSRWKRPQLSFALGTAAPSCGELSTTALPMLDQRQTATKQDGRSPWTQSGPSWRRSSWKELILARNWSGEPLRWDASQWSWGRVRHNFFPLTFGLPQSWEQYWCAHSTNEWNHSQTFIEIL